MLAAPDRLKVFHVLRSALTSEARQSFSMWNNFEHVYRIAIAIEEKGV